MKFGNASGISQSKIESSDVAVLSGERDPNAVRRDASGLVTAFRILKVGPWRVTIDGQRIEALVGPDDIRKVSDHFAAKGELIPVDCEHLLAYLAEMKKVDEATLVRAEPLLGEKAAAGFVRLTSENDGTELWANVESWSARARELLTVTGDRMYMYFSGVLRGLKDGLLRITSIALTNTPAEDNQAGLIALCGEGALFLSAISTHKETNMTWLKKLGALLKRDVATLTADASLEPVLQAAHEQIEAAAAIFPSFRAQVKDTLKLTGDEDPTQVAGLVLSLAAKSEADAQALTALRTRVTDLESAERSRLEDRLTAEGKLTQGLRDSAWFKSLDFVALKAWGEVAPVVVKPGRETPPSDRAIGGEGVLTETGRAVALACGCKPEDVAKANGLKVE
jgi:mannitol/fructose-specific phosphotransferase system IIA component